MKVQFSIPAYRSIVHTKTMFCFGEFLLHAKSKGWDVGCYCPDSCDVDHAQNLIIAKALKDEMDFVLMMGSDNHAPAIDLIRMILEASKRDAALIAAPCKHRGGGLNVGADSPERIEETVRAIENREIFRPDRIGFGIVVFNLKWYRAKWNVGPWLESLIYCDGEGMVKRESQDYRHCEDVKQRGGLVLADPRVNAGHEIEMRKGA